MLSAGALQVIQAIRVDANAVYRVAAAGQSVTVAGAGLTEVSTVRGGSAIATINAKSATQLVFVVPSGLACGAIALESTSKATVAGGSVVVGGGCVATVGGVEFAQVLPQGPSDARLRLVPGKETWVRMYVVASQTGVPAPLVRLTGYNGAAILGTVTMAGPAKLPLNPFVQTIFENTILGLVGSLKGGEGRHRSIVIHLLRAVSRKPDRNGTQP